jgi:ERCC4-related helicase
MVEMVKFATGSRVDIRGEEWLVKSTHPISTGGNALRVVGLSELVRDQECMFLTKLETIIELKPEETDLVIDPSPQYRKTRLYLESLLRRTPPTDTKIHLGHRAAINLVPYQLEPAQMALEALRPRILIADGVGLGKTIEAGILITELIKRGRGERILVVAIRSMLAQFQEELWARFAIPLVRLDSVGLQKVRSKIPSNKNPFYYYDRVIISVDTLKNDAQYRHYLEETHWDVIVIDECHNVANAGSQRNRLAGLLARTCDSLILTSATPHNGKPESFANLMNMLEPTAIADQSNYSAEEIEGLFVRRFKKDIQDQVVDQFSDREVEIKKTQASQAEEKFFDLLAEADFHTLDSHRSGDELYRINLLKGFLSSPDAVRQTLTGRIRKIERRLARLLGESIEEENSLMEEDALKDLEQVLLESEEKKRHLIEDLMADKELLEALVVLAEAVSPEVFSKYQMLLETLAAEEIDASPESPRVIIFSERIATLRFLKAHLQAVLGAGEESIVQFHAGLPDVEQTRIVESFGKEDSPIRILLASNVASEGVNLHYFCHKMIHFDIPWSLITLEQRNGRIDRYGQHETPQIHYLLTESSNETVRGDLRILDRLIEKEQEAHKNIGDAGALLGLYDAQREEEKITEGVAAGKREDEIIPEQPVDLMSEFFKQAPKPKLDEKPVAAVPTLYSNDFSFTRAAFDELMSYDPDLPAPEYHPERPAFTFLAPEDLRRRCEFIPDEAIPGDWIFSLTTDRDRVQEAIEAARKLERTWPQQQLFWEIHPVMSWLMDRLLVRFGRHEAPVVISPHMQESDSIFLFQGVISNQRSQPLITEWFGVWVSFGREWKRLTLDEVFEQTGFKNGLPNPQHSSEKVKQIQANLDRAVSDAKIFMEELRLERGKVWGDQLRADIRKLTGWYQASVASIEAKQETAVGANSARLSHEKEEIKKIYQQRQEWLEDTFTAVPLPYIRLAAVFSGN